MPRPSAASTSRRPALRERHRRPALPGHGALAAAVPRQARDAVRLSDEPVVTLDHTADEAAAARQEQIDEFYQRPRARRSTRRKRFGAAPYKPVRPELALSDSRRMDAGARDQSHGLALLALREPGAHLPCRWAASAAAASRPSAPSRTAIVYEAVQTHAETLRAGRQARGHRQLDRRLARAPGDDPQGP